MITDKLVEVEPEIRNELTDEQLKNTFDSKPKWQRAAIMFAGPLANFLLAILVFSIVFMNTTNLNNVATVQNINESVLFQTSNNINIGDEIVGINSQTISDPKDIPLELLSYAGFSGEINLNLLNRTSGETYRSAIIVNDFLSTSELQKDPLSALGLDIEYKNLAVIGKVTKGSSAELAGLESGDIITKIDSNSIVYIQDINNLIKDKPNSSIDLIIERDGNNIFKQVDLDSFINTEGKSVGSLGVQFGSKRSFIESIVKGTYETYNLSLKTLQFIGKMITGNMGAENLSGPIGIAQMAGDTAKAGIIPFIFDGVIKH